MINVFQIPAKVLWRTHKKTKQNKIINIKYNDKKIYKV